MVACPDCQRLRTPGGLHICLAEALAVRGLTVAATPDSGPRSLSRRLDSGTGRGVVTEKKPICSENYMVPRPVSAFSLPGDGPAAQVWNALVARRTS